MRIGNRQIGKVVYLCKIYNADDEFPDCNQCDNMDNCDGGIVGKDSAFQIKCGAEHGWNGYRRFEIIKGIDR